MKHPLLYSIIIFCTSLSLPAEFYQDNSSQLYGLNDENGKALTAAIFSDIHTYSDRIAKVKSNGKWGIINSKGKYIVHCLYDSIGPFVEGKSRVVFEKKVGFINGKGKEVIPCEYENAYNFKNGVSRVKNNDKWGIIDATGKSLTLCIFDAISPFYGKVSLVKLDKKIGLIDNQGNNLLPLTATKYKWLSKGTISLQDDKGHWQTFNTLGKRFNELKSTDLKSFSKNILRAQNGEKWGIIDQTGKWVLPAIFDEITKLSNSRARIKDGKLYGYIDEKAEMVMPPKFDFASEFKSGIAQIKNGDNWEWITPRGVSIISKEDVVNPKGLDEIQVIEPEQPPVIDPNIEQEALQRINQSLRDQERISAITNQYYIPFSYNSPRFYHRNPWYHRPRHYYRSPIVHYHGSKWNIHAGGSGWHFNLNSFPNFTIRF